MVSTEVNIEKVIQYISHIPCINVVLLFIELEQKIIIKNNIVY